MLAQQFLLSNLRCLFLLFNGESHHRSSCHTILPPTASCTHTRNNHWGPS